MITKTIRPIGMDHINNVYYPMGLPDKDDSRITWYWDEYFDQNYNKYSICYTKQQVESSVENKHDYIFNPYRPLTQV